MKRVFKYRSTENLTKSANKELARLMFSGWIIRVLVYGVYVAAVALTTAFLFTFMQPIPEWSFPLKPVTIFGIIILLLYYSSKKFWPWIWEVVKKRRGFDFESNLSSDENDYAVMVDDEGVCIESKHGQNSTFWSGINKLSITEKFVFLHRRYDAVIIPISCFKDDQDVDEFEESSRSLIVENRDEDETQ